MRLNRLCNRCSARTRQRVEEIRSNRQALPRQNQWSYNCRDRLQLKQHMIENRNSCNSSRSLCSSLNLSHRTATIDADSTTQTMWISSKQLQSCIQLTHLISWALILGRSKQEHAWIASLVEAVLEITNRLTTYSLRIRLRLTTWFQPIYSTRVRGWEEVQVQHHRTSHRWLVMDTIKGRQLANITSNLACT